MMQDVSAVVHMYHPYNYFVLSIFGCVLYKRVNGRSKQYMMFLTILLKNNTSGNRLV